MSRPDSYPDPGEPGPPDQPPTNRSRRPALSLRSSHTLIASGVAGVVAVVLIMWGLPNNDPVLTRAGLGVFALAFMIWLTILGMLIIRVFTDAGRAILKRKQTGASTQPPGKE